MKVTFLGSGTSHGVPVIGCHCPVCESSDERDKRYRSSIMLEKDNKRLVIDTVLNRVDSSYYPNTISEVIWQKGQFSSMYNGRVNKCYVSDDICRLIKEELEYRRDTSVIYFRTGYYSSYGKPMYQVGNHYFSSY